MPGDGGRDAQEIAVGDGGDAFDVAVMVVHELHVLDQRAEALPAGKGRRPHQQAPEHRPLGNVRIDNDGDAAEVIGRQPAFRCNDQ
jgi:hypothetical protein